MIKVECLSSLVKLYSGYENAHSVETDGVLVTYKYGYEDYHGEVEMVNLMLFYINERTGCNDDRP